MGQASRAEQVAIYLGKNIRLFKNENGWKSLISALFISLIISAVVDENMFDAYHATRNGAFVLICACIWIGIFNSIQSVCKERGIIKREHRSGMHISSYIVAHMVFDAALCLAETGIVSVVTLFSNRAHYPAEGVLFSGVTENFITFFLLIYSADLLGLMVSCIVKTPPSAMIVMPFVLIFELVLSGFIFDLEGIMERAANITVSKWGLNALCITANVNKMPGAVPAYVPDYQFVSSNLLDNWKILILFTLLYAAVAVICLEFIDRDKR